MNISKIRIAQLVVFILWLECCRTIADTTNKLHMDRFACDKLKPGSNVQNLSCLFKYISWKNVKIDVNWYFPKPVDIVWVNLDFYHKFNSISYQKFPINVWENLCDFLEGKRNKTFGMNWMLGKLMPFSNMNRCPLQGLQYFRVSNISMDIFDFKLSLMPSGSYRVGCTFADRDRVKLFAFKMYGSISDHRLEVF